MYNLIYIININIDNLLHALWALRPCDPRNGAMIGQCIREIQKITEMFF